MDKNVNPIYWVCQYLIQIWVEKTQHFFKSVIVSECSENIKSTFPLMFAKL